MQPIPTALVFVMTQTEFERTFTKLPPRRKAILLRILAGEPDASIAQTLEIGEATVRKHIERTCESFGLKGDESTGRRSRRSDLITLIARHKPELLQAKPDDRPVSRSEQPYPPSSTATVPKGKRTPQKGHAAKASTESFQVQSVAQDEDLLALDARLQHQGLAEILSELQAENNETQQREIAKALNKKGFQLYMTGEFAEAQPFLEAAIQLNPNLEAAHFNLGSLYEKRQELDKAKEHYRKASEYPEFRGAHAARSNLARLEILDGNFLDAIAHIQKSLEQTIDRSVQASLYKNLGWAYFKQGQYAEAEIQLQKAIELSPDRAAPYCLMAQIMEKTEKYPEAKLYWKNCLEDEDGNPREANPAWRSPEIDLWQNQAKERLYETIVPLF